MSANARANYHHGDLQAQLLAVASELVAEHGVESVSLRQIAATLGVSPSAVYHHFPDKSALLATLAGQVHEDLGSSVEAARVATIDPIARLGAIGRAYFDFAVAHQNLFRLAFGPFCPKQEEGERNSLAYQALVLTLGELRRQNLLPLLSDEAATLLAWSSIHGAANLAIDGILPVAAAQELLDGVILAITQRKYEPKQVRPGAGTHLLQRVSNDELDYESHRSGNDRASEILRERPPHHF